MRRWRICSGRVVWFARTKVDPWKETAGPHFQYTVQGRATQSDRSSQCMQAVEEKPAVPTQEAETGYCLFFLCLFLSEGLFVSEGRLGTENGRHEGYSLLEKCVARFSVMCYM